MNNLAIKVTAMLVCIPRKFSLRYEKLKIVYLFPVYITTIGIRSRMNDERISYSFYRNY